MRKVPRLRLTQPQLPVYGAEIEALLHQIIAVHFPENIAPPAVFFGCIPTLAHIENSQSESGASIWMHQALNDPATPDYVFSFVLKHELLHTRVVPRRVDGKWLVHPPEFWEEENRISQPDKVRAWDWLYSNFASALKRDNDFECIWVNQKRMKQLLHNRYCAERDVQHL
jgi:hypothetical protein